MNEIREVLEELYSDGSYDEEFPTDPKRHTRIDAALTSIASEIERMKKPADIHSGHTFDENWCYHCRRIVDEESDEWKNVGNGIYNQAISDIAKMIRGQESTSQKGDEDA